MDRDNTPLGGRLRLSCILVRTCPPSRPAFPLLPILDHGQGAVELSPLASGIPGPSDEQAANENTRIRENTASDGRILRATRVKALATARAVFAVSFTGLAGRVDRKTWLRSLPT